MAITTQNLADKIITSIINGESLTNILLQAQLFANLADVPIFKEWVHNELNGYSDISEIPDYRKVDVYAIYAIFENRFGEYLTREIPRGVLDECIADRVYKLTFSDTIAELENIDKSAKNDISNNLKKSLPTYYFRAFENCFEGDDIFKVQEAYQLVSASSASGVITTIKSRLLSLMCKIIEEMKLEVNFDSKMKEVMAQIINNTIYTQSFNTGNNNVSMSDSNMAIGEKASIQLSSTDKKELLDLYNRLEDLNKRVDEDETELAEYLVELKSEIDKKMSSPAIIRKTLRAIKSLGVIARDKIIEIALEKGIDMFANF